MENKLSLFEATGIEMEYMVVDSETLKVKPIVEKILTDFNDGELTDEVERGEVTWSNELVAHVIELKGTEPLTELNGTHRKFHKSLQDINQYLKKEKALLLPTAMHPTMDPFKETMLWPHGQKEIYGQFDKIFSCKGHGWSNLQSVHINLPFANEDEFGRLHAAIRLLLPIIPHLAASSPIMEGKVTGVEDNRLVVYENNQKKVPLITGQVIPEDVFTFSGYQELYQTIFKSIAPLDPDGILQHPWLNSRGAIPKFPYGALEIRIIDTQEAPVMDFALATLFVETLKRLAGEVWMSYEDQKKMKTVDLKAIYDLHLQSERIINNSAYLNALGVKENKLSVNELWQKIFEEVEVSMGDDECGGVGLILTEGNLSKRLMKRLGGKPSLNEITSTYREIAKCLEQNRAFRA